ncbi:hypothetical protein [Staphylococcus phage vB_SsapH-Golestan-105-M]|nr:hypothetical protein [Staphylococcus phage vB_SsapH-Golestan-105-M]
MRIYISNDYNKELLDKCLSDINKDKGNINYSMNYGEGNIKKADVEIIKLDKNLLETESRAFSYSKFVEDCIFLFPYKIALLRGGKIELRFDWNEIL